MTDLPSPPTFKKTLIRLVIALVLIGGLVVATINYSTYTPSADAEKKATR